MNKAASIDEYLAGVPEDARATLRWLRQVIKAIAPEAAESISYGMPAFKYKGRPLIYMGAARRHCGPPTLTVTLSFRNGEECSLPALGTDERAREGVRLSELIGALSLASALGWGSQSSTRGSPAFWQCGRARFLARTSGHGCRQ